ncbi:MAG TPA: hypothetical protein VK846_01045 [Candidatus Limnocylindria bacterium]|nr:hypothetical protein [Candidatus Limnocylindria bacterium]
MKDLTVVFAVLAPALGWFFYRFLTALNKKSARDANSDPKKER